MELKKLKWEARQRLRFIETRLFWDGKLNRNQLVEEFGISGVQATKDIARYAELAPQNLTYDSSQKTYLTTPDFEPSLIDPLADDLFWQGHTQGWRPGSETLPVEGLPIIHRNVDQKILRAVLKAVRNQANIEIIYQSMSKQEPGKRWISPHSFVHDGKRWHVRGYCFASNMFKDFLLARILEVGDERPGIIFKAEDQEWNQTVKLEIMPHPGLSEGQKKVIETDFGMFNGILVVEIRKAMVPYFLLKYNLGDHDHEAPPESQQIVLKKTKEAKA